MEYVTLNNGVKMSKLGYGVYQTPAGKKRSAVSAKPLRWDTAASIPPQAIRQ